MLGFINVILTILVVSLIYRIFRLQKIKKELQKERVLFQTFIDSIPYQAFQKDAQLRYCRFNKAFEIYSKTPRSDILGKTIFDVFPYERAQKINDMDVQFLSSPEKQIRYETIQLDGYDQWRDYLVTKTKFYQSDGALAGFVSHAFDITEQKNLERALIQTNKQLCYQRDQMLTSLEDAGNIQLNILPEKSVIYDAFRQNIFIFFKPKDRVSGDFYWFTRTKNFLLLAVADCIGHGIPSALMTILGHSLLEYIVHEKEIVRPDLILEHLENKWRASLQLRDSQSEIADGMELGLCVFDFGASQLQFSGARRPLYHVHDRTLEQIDGSPFSIGGRHIKKEKTFALHTRSFVADDVFYLSTDGFYDQLNENGRRFMSKPFKDCLLSIADQPIVEQEQRLEAQFQQWRGNKFQTDDILVAGVKI
ncbi:MAG: SpoIIE family protein phosphatase [Verrucomicrobiota bacterium]